MRVWKLFKSTNMLFSICFRHQQFNIFSPEFSQKTFHPLKNKSFVVICIFICKLQALLHIQSGLVQDMWLRQTSQKLRMLSMSLSDCQSQILKVRVQDSQFVRKSQLCHKVTKSRGFLILKASRPPPRRCLCLCICLCLCLCLLKINHKCRKQLIRWVVLYPLKMDFNDI